MADTRGDDLAPVIQEILRKNYLQSAQKIALKNTNAQAVNSSSLDNVNDKEQTVIMIGQKGKDGKPQFNTIVETNPKGQVIVQQVNPKGQLEDVSNQYNAIAQGQQQRVATADNIYKDNSNNIISNRASDKVNTKENDLVPNLTKGQPLEDLNRQIYARENVRSNGQLDQKVERSIQANLYPEKAIQETLGQQSAKAGKISFQQFNQDLNAKGLEARLAKTGEYLNGFPKVKVELYNAATTNTDTISDTISNASKNTPPISDWTNFHATTIQQLKDKVDLGQEYQRRFPTEIVYAQRADLKSKLEASELTANKIIMTRDGERVNFSFQDNKGNKEVLEKLNKLPSNEAIQIAQQYNENINQSDKGIATDATAYDQKIANAIPLPTPQKNEQRQRIA